MMCYLVPNNFPCRLKDENFFCITKTNQLSRFMEIIGVCSETYETRRVSIMQSFKLLQQVVQACVISTGL